MLLGWTIKTTLALAVRLKIYSPCGCNKLDTLKFTNAANDLINNALVFILELAP